MSSAQASLAAPHSEFCANANVGMGCDLWTTVAGSGRARGPGEVGVGGAGCSLSLGRPKIQHKSWIGTLHSTANIPRPGPTRCLGQHAHPRPPYLTCPVHEHYRYHFMVLPCLPKQGSWCADHADSSSPTIPACPTVATLPLPVTTPHLPRPGLPRAPNPLQH